MSTQDTKTKTNVDVDAANAKAKEAAANAEKTAEQTIADMLSSASNSPKKPLSQTEVQALTVLAMGGKIICDLREVGKHKYLSESPDGTVGSFSHGRRGIWELLRGKAKRFGIVETSKEGVTVLTIPEMSYRVKAARAVKAVS